MESPVTVLHLLLLVSFVKVSFCNIDVSALDGHTADTILTVPSITKSDTQEPARVRRSEQSDDYIEITLPTPGKDIILRLISTESLFVPGATFEIRTGNISTATPVRRDCYYQGKVKDRNESFAALSICNGLIGMYELEGEQYSIEPVQPNKAGQDNSQRLHAIKKMKRTEHDTALDSSFEMTESRERSKRAVTTQKYLEVMVVIDKTMIDFHGEDNTELFVLALFNMVNMIYSHLSLGVNIKLSLVKLVLLEDETAENMWKGDNPRQTLDKFCMWAAVNSLREHEPGHYDFAMYLSRDRMSPAGYAPVTGMCRPDRSCALITESGFSTSFVAAHEIGHTIGLSHDGEGTNKCVNEPKRGSIMAPLVMANLNNYFWSPCSAEEISSIVDTLYCMNNNPTEVKWSTLEAPLGKNWDLDEQCEKEFGKGFRLCSRVTHNFSPCEVLWCSTPKQRNLCKTKRAPPLPGSLCANHMRCFNSQCVVARPDDVMWTDQSLGRDRLKSIDGSWSKWSSWSECSTTCGRGIKSRTRICNKPEPALRGRDCSGESYDLRLCNLPEQMRVVCRMFSTLSYSVRRTCMKHKVYYRTCKSEIDDMRLDQCTRYNKRGRTYLPFEPEEEEDKCLLNCKTKEQSIPLYGGIEAMDGTFCSYTDRNAMCYAGKCIPVGCDGKINSGAKEDMCGECQGDNSKCTLRQDYYNERLSRGYQLLVRLYPGTRNFRIKKPDDVYKLVVRNAKTNETLLSERTRHSIDVVDHGSLWKFSNTRSQTLECSGPLQAEYDIIIYSIYNGLRATMSITFTEPLSVVRGTDREVTTQRQPRRTSRPTKKKYTWVADSWGECNQPCGEGIQEQRLACKNTKLNKTVHELLCKSEEKPNSMKKTCTLKPCDVRYRWVVSEWTRCPADVCTVNEASQRRWRFCVEENSQLAERSRRVRDSLCSSIEPPILSKPCNTSSCTQPGYWRTKRFSQCSATCGRGLQTRSVTCLPVNPSNPYQALCDEKDKPSDSETCMNRPCRYYTTKTLISHLSPTPGQQTTPTVSEQNNRPTTKADSHLVDGVFKEFTRPKFTRVLESVTKPVTVMSYTYEISEQTVISAGSSTPTNNSPVETTTTESTTTWMPEASVPETSTDTSSTKSGQSTTMTSAINISTTSAATANTPSTVTQMDKPDAIPSLLATRNTSAEEVTNPTTFTYSITTESLLSDATSTTTDGVTIEANNITTTARLTATTKSTNIDVTTSQISATTKNLPPNATLSVDSPTTSGDTTTKFVWWWTAKTTTKATPKVVWWWTSLSPTEKTSGPEKVEVSRTTTLSNRVPNSLSSFRPSECKADSSSICELMSRRKCQLLLFKKLCCHTCLQLQ